MPAESDQPAGVLLVNKPMDWTSHDVVKFVRGFGVKKVGHCGTLDPAATGLLVLVLGKATRLTDLFSGQDKAYEGTMRLGVETSTEDSEGEIIAEKDWRGVTEEQVRALFKEFLGDQMQIPPMVSAKKQGGKTLYKLARQGIVVEREPRPITIHEFEVKKLALPDIDFAVKCTKGTYVRTLSADIGRRLGCGAYLKALCRTASGRFRLDSAFPLEEVRTWNRETLYQKFMPLEVAVAYV